MHILSLQNNFVPFLEATWQKQTATNPRRGLTDEGSSVLKAKQLTAVQKNAHLNLLLGQIASFCPVRNLEKLHGEALYII